MQASVSKDITLEGHISSSGIIVSGVANSYLTLSGKIFSDDFVLSGIVNPSIALTGHLSPKANVLSGVLNSRDKLVGNLALPTGYTYFNGPYEVTPKINSQTIETKDKLMAKNISVKSIPYYEVTNSYNGLTIIIGGNDSGE